MKKIYLWLMLLPAVCGAQSFNNSTVTPVPNNGSDLIVPVTVSGLPPAINSAFGLTTICFTITHEYDAELRIRLQSPDGTMITLVDQKGSSGDNFMYTCLEENAPGWIMNGTAPFNGNYLPQQSLNNLNNGQNPNGTWNFIITDLFVPADTGSFHFVSLLFGINPPPDPAITGPCSSANPGGCQCPDSTSANCDLLPDITASELSMLQDHFEFAGKVTVGVATPNIGWGPLEINGTSVCYCDTVVVPCSVTACPNGDPPKQVVDQRIYHRTGNAMTYWDRPAGTMSYHPSHAHIHIDNWLDYTLRVATSNPDARTWPIVARGDKQSFCLINLSDCDAWFGFCVDTAGNNLHVADLPNAYFGSVSGCGTSQGIYVGSIDEYNSGLNGNGIPTTDLCNVQYYIVAIVDYLNNILETNEDNNWAAIPVTLTMANPGQFDQPGFYSSVNGLQLSVIANALAPDSLVWQWGDGSSSVTTSTFAVHNYTTPGTYVVWLYSYNHCGPVVSTDTIEILATGMSSIEATTDQLFIQPNPVKTITNCVYYLSESSSVLLKLYNSLGQPVKKLINENKSAGRYFFPLNVKNEKLSRGVYYLKLTTETANKSVRIIVL